MQATGSEELTMGHTLHIGAPTVIESYADKTPYGAVFEDDGKLAYFYAVDRRVSDSATLDAVCIYHITAVIERHMSDLDIYHPYDVRIVWSEDQLHAALLLDGVAHAAFDFAEKRAYCRSCFPSGSAWCPEGHAWDDRAVEFLGAVTDAVPQPAVRFTMLP
ncbi:MAG TPA: DUF2251 domain-containing protein [Gemmatimonadaceae bacterium]|nr:DUF2251 domain-containing protein [Gemmatimonadaceae bacterium]